MISSHVYQTCSVYFSSLPRTLRNNSLHYLSTVTSIRCWLLSLSLSLSLPVPLQDEKNQVLITNAWLQLVCLLSKHILCDHCIIVMKYIFGKCACCLCPVGSHLTAFRVTKYDSSCYQKPMAFNRDSFPWPKWRVLFWVSCDSVEYKLEVYAQQIASVV